MTAPVFDLPESTIPDEDKTEGNLPARNLTRSRKINISCGEDLALALGVDPKDILTPTDIEPDERAWKFFMDDKNVYPEKNGAGEPISKEPFFGFRDERFKTPSWYYILREGQVKQNGASLGRMGSQLVAEVVIGAIYYGTLFAYKDQPDAVILNGKKQGGIMFRDLIDFVHE